MRELGWKRDQDGEVSENWVGRARDQDGEVREN